MVITAQRDSTKGDYLHRRCYFVLHEFYTSFHSPCMESLVRCLSGNTANNIDQLDGTVLAAISTAVITRLHGADYRVRQHSKA